MKKKFRLEDYPGQEMRMICYNEEEAKTFCNFLKSCGKTWKSGDSYEETNWLECFGPLLKSGNFVMAYYFNQGCYHPTSRNVANESINVCPEECLNFSDFDWEEKIMFKFEIGERVVYTPTGGSDVGVVVERHKCDIGNLYTVVFDGWLHTVVDILESRLAKVPATDTNVGTKPDYSRNIQALMQHQRDKGMKKYGETLEDNVTLSTTQRIEHAEEELIDCLQYLEHLKVAAQDSVTINDYQRMAMRTAGEKSENYLDNAVMGLAGEVGECADIVKKHHFQGHDLDKDHLAEELGDVLWYAALMATALEIPLQEVCTRNIEKLVKRYPEGFDKARSINREKDK